MVDQSTIEETEAQNDFFFFFKATLSWVVEAIFNSGSLVWVGIVVI